MPWHVERDAAMTHHVPTMLGPAKASFGARGLGTARAGSPTLTYEGLCCHPVLSPRRERSSFRISSPETPA